MGLGNHRRFFLRFESDDLGTPWPSFHILIVVEAMCDCLLDYLNENMFKPVDEVYPW